MPRKKFTLQGTLEALLCTQLFLQCSNRSDQVPSKLCLLLYGFPENTHKVGGEGLYSLPSGLWMLLWFFFVGFFLFFFVTEGLFLVTGGGLPLMDVVNQPLRVSIQYVPFLNVIR